MHVIRWLFRKQNIFMRESLTADSSPPSLYTQVLCVSVVTHENYSQMLHWCLLIKRNVLVYLVQSNLYDTGVPHRDQTHRSTPEQYPNRNSQQAYIATYSLNSPGRFTSVDFPLKIDHVDGHNTIWYWESTFF